MNMNFDPSQVEARNNATLPDGKHRLAIVGSTLKTNAGGTTQLELTFKVSEEGECAGLEFRTWYTYICPKSPAAEQIGRAQLKELCESIGILHLMDSDELVGKEVIASTKHRVDKKTHAVEEFPSAEHFYPVGGASVPPEMDFGNARMQAPAPAPVPVPAPASANQVRTYPVPLPPAAPAYNSAQPPAQTPSVPAWAHPASR